MKNINKLILLGAIVFATISCEDRLEQVNPNEVTVDSYYTNLSETEAGVTAIYSTLLNHFVLNIESETERADMGYPGWGRNTPSNASQSIWYFHTYSNTQTEVTKKWEACYQGIWRANQVIEGLQKLEAEIVAGGSEALLEVWTRQMAEARFFRGWFHYNLHLSFNNGEIIIRDAVPQSDDDFNKDISSSQEVIDFFRKDLVYAYENLPARHDESINSNVGRVTAGTAATILGNSHLFQEEYSEAIPYYEDVMTNPEYGYELVKDMGLMFTNSGELNDESIFEVLYNETQRTELNQWDELSQSNRLGRSGNGGQWYPSLWIIWAYKNEVMDTKDPRNYYTRPSDDKDTIRVVPLRCSAMIAVTEDEHSIYYIDGYTGENMNFNVNGGQIAFYKKYGNHELYVDEGATPLGTGWKSGKNVIVNRLAEVYLNYAEAMMMTGDIQAALDAMNAIRARWGLRRLGVDDGSGPDFDGVNYTAETLMEKLMYVDKPLELSSEGMSIRWIDMRRWGITKSRFESLATENYHMVDYTLNTLEGGTFFNGRSSLQLGEDPGTNLTFKDYEVAAQNYIPNQHDYYPIPLSEILTNSSLSSLSNN
ncbi:MAG: RagB/SusD family nutrient uptake outer membrane protein [Cyclobacteriaceae bacterium]